jgi:hypothetical protein
MRIDLKIPSMRARVVIFVGEYDDIKNDKVFKQLGMTCFDSHVYTGRCTYLRAGGRLTHTAVIHSKSKAISVIAHEAVHAASFIISEMGDRASFENDEVVAYLVQYICEEAENALKVYES